MNTKQAIDALTESFMEDQSLGSYYHSWVCNMAMNFHDEYYRRKNELIDAEDEGKVLHEIFISASKNFLTQLMTSHKSEIVP